MSKVPDAMVESIQLTLAGEDRMMAFGRLLAAACQVRGTVYGTIYLQGSLGAGKTTLCRGVMRGLGYEGVVKSPTYTLVEPYEMEQMSVYHLDLYRLSDPEELDFLGIRDYFDTPSLCLVEWPERGRTCLPAADIVLSVEYLSEARIVTVTPQTEHGQTICQTISARREMLAEDICWVARQAQV